ncbi:hypothetical protein FNF27_04495 [Cafeteria roenbergensis]|uniref:U-box domain-containing protein n=1 Tax=Cafeteria roenbergensis TaxID=33653 RepID=A0A5A8E9L3_CAFRO|nr:hypothetical protein FNF27_04495 [Cafeteria roenbergensis]
MAAACGGSDAEVFDELLCPLSRRLFFDPVTLPCGHSFSRAPLVMALGARRECPLCRSPFFSPATQLARNFALASIVEHRFPEAYKRRLEEAEEDGETAPATGMLDLPVAFIACNTPTAQPAPDAAGAEHVFPPGFPIDLVFFEPRYLALIDRVMGTTARRFAVQPTRDAAMGAVAGAAALPINAHFGQPPLRPGPLTFYLSALLDLSAEERRRAMQTELLSERQQLLLEFLLRIAAQSDKSADAAPGAGRAGAAAGGAAAGGAAAGGAAAGGDGGTLRHRRDRGEGPEAIAAGSRAAAADAAPEAEEAGAAGSRGDGPGTAAAAQPVLAAGATSGDDSDPLDRVEAGRALWMLSRTRLGRKSTLLGGFSQAQGPLAALSTLLLLVVVLLLAGNRAAWEANHGDLA